MRIDSKVSHLDVIMVPQRAGKGTTDSHVRVGRSIFLEQTYRLEEPLSKASLTLDQICI